jgi:hypothetical protein
MMQAVGDWLFGKKLVYRVSEPDRMLRQRKIHWDRETSDLEDEHGRLYYNVSWDDIEFVDGLEHHCPEKD